MMYCSKCGKELADTARCCSVCGGAPAATPPSDPVQPAAAAKTANTSASGVWKLFFPANILGIAGCLVLLLSTFMTFLSVSFMGLSEKMSLMDGSDGKVFLVAAIIGIVLCFMRKSVIQIINLVYSCLLTAMALYETSNTTSAMGDLGSFSSAITKGAGYYLLVLGALVYLVSAVCALIARKKAA